MAYIGKAPNTAIVNQTTSQSFNGTGSATAFTLNRSVNVSEDLEVFVNNVQQEPGSGKAYTASGTTLTFSAAPASGTGNIYVIYRGEATINPRLEHDANAALAATTGTFSGAVSGTTGTFSGAFTSPGIDDNADATAITIDSSENVLVGKSVTTLNTTGLNINGPDGRLEATASGNVSGIFNRTSSDGSIVDVRKDGTVVGSISVSDANNLSIDCNTTDHAGLTFATENILPRKNSANTDNAVDLGAGSARFKNAYLSGNLYLGGTGSANALDDYETGTWTPNIGGNATYHQQSGTYTKIGRAVYIWFYIQINARNSSATTLVYGWPFTPATSNQYIGVAYHASIHVSVYSIHGNLRSDNSMRFDGHTAAGDTQSSGLSTFVDGTSIIASGVYYI